MADPPPRLHGVLPEGSEIETGSVALREEPALSLRRVFDDGGRGVTPGTAQRIDSGLIWSVAPGEWTIAGVSQIADPGAIDLTHVRAVFRLGGSAARDVLANICALDFDNDMFFDGRAARTSVAGVATEIVRDDEGGGASYLLLPSRSFGVYFHEALVDACTGY